MVRCRHGRDDRMTYVAVFALLFFIAAVLWRAAMEELAALPGPEYSVLVTPWPYEPRLCRWHWELRIADGTYATRRSDGLRVRLGLTWAGGFTITRVGARVAAARAAQGHARRFTGGLERKAS